jgi:hypothetical protein
MNAQLEQISDFKIIAVRWVFLKPSVVVPAGTIVRGRQACVEALEKLKHSALRLAKPDDKASARDQYIYQAAMIAIAASTKLRLIAEHTWIIVGTYPDGTREQRQSSNHAKAQLILKKCILKGAGQDNLANQLIPDFEQQREFNSVADKLKKKDWPIGEVVGFAEKHGFNPHLTDAPLAPLVNRYLNYIKDRVLAGKCSHHAIRFVTDLGNYFLAYFPKQTVQFALHNLGSFINGDKPIPFVESDTQKLLPDGRPGFRVRYIRNGKTSEFWRPMPRQRTARPWHRTYKEMVLAFIRKFAAWLIWLDDGMDKHGKRIVYFTQEQYEALYTLPALTQEDKDLTNKANQIANAHIFSDWEYRARTNEAWDYKIAAIQIFMDYLGLRLHEINHPGDPERNIKPCAYNFQTGVFFVNELCKTGRRNVKA